MSESDVEEQSCEEEMDVEEVEVPELERNESEDEIRTARIEALKKLQEEVLVNGEGESSSSDRQLAYLMSQSEVFAHFLTDGDDLVPTDKRKKKKVKTGGLGGGVGRTRMSEEAEDRRMMKLAQSKGNDGSRVWEQPHTITGGTMRSYQVEGLSWMMKLYDNCINGILADEMGLGKTLQTISLLAYLNEARRHPGPHLVVVPKSTVGNWMREFAKWCPTLRTVKLLGSKEERAHIVNTELKTFYTRKRSGSSSTPDSTSKGISANKLAKLTAESIPFNVLVTSYESCMREKSAILKLRWKYLVIDEAHRIKNEKSALAQITRLFKVDHRLLVTGTPLQNNLHELWALLNFLMPEVFASSSIFDSWFNTDDKAGKDNVIKKLHTVLKPFMLRRVKADVEKDLPPKKEIKLYIGLSAMQKEWYKKVLTKDIAALNALGGPDKTRLLNVLMQLRKVCNHPYLFEGAEYGPPYIDGPHIWETCGKMILLDKLLSRLKATGSRVLIFSQMTRMLDILEDYIRFKRYEYCRIDGNTSGELREEMMDAFQEKDSSKFVFLLSTRAGGLGINLTAADTVILYDSDFNPQMDLQAMDRAHRIGQKKEVRVFRFITEGTVEEKIIERADRKLFLDAAVIQQGRLTDQMSNNMNKSELMRMVKFGADAILSNQGGDYTDEDIETLLTRGEERTEEIKGKLQTEVQHTLANFSVQMEDTEKSMNLFEFAGENFLAGDEKGKDESGGLSLGLELGTRERRRSTFDVINYTDNIDLEGKPKGQKEPGAKKLNKKNVYTLPDYQFFDRPRLDEIYTLEAELSQARGEQVKLIKKLRHEDEVEARRLERARNRKKANSNKVQAVDRGNGIDESAEDKETDQMDVCNGSEGAEEQNSVEEKEQEGQGSTNNEPVQKSEMALEADRLEAELGSEPFPNFSTLAQEIQFYHTRALLRKDGKGNEEDDIVCGKFNIPHDMQQEKEKLILEGFPAWTKVHLRAFVNGMERFGRDNLIKVANFMKRDASRSDIIPEDEVRRYADVFWKRHGELGEWQTFLRKVEKGDKRAARLQTIRQSMEERLVRYYEDLGEPLQVDEDGLIDVSGIAYNDTKFKPFYGTSGRGKLFTTDIDRCLLLTVYKLGFGDCDEEWEEFRKEIIRRPEFRFNFFLKSRSPTDLQKRCDFLVKMTEKDNIRVAEQRKLEFEEAKKEERARKKALKRMLKMEKERELTLLENGENVENGHQEHNGNSGDTQGTTALTIASPDATMTTSSTPPSSKKDSNKKKRNRKPVISAVDGDRTYKKSKRGSRRDMTDIGEEYSTAGSDKVSDSMLTDKEGQTSSQGEGTHFDHEVDEPAVVFDFSS